MDYADILPCQLIFIYSSQLLDLTGFEYGVVPAEELKVGHWYAVLPLRPGIPEKRSHDYIRHGTTALFAALEAATGKVTGACYPQHRHEEFLAFLRQVATAYPRVPLHLVCDNYGTRTHPDVRAWLDKHSGSACTSRRRPGRG
jgi:hypothetical protein